MLCFLANSFNCLIDIVFKSSNVCFSTVWSSSIFLISLSQIIALIPGVSRSGITISTGLFLNLSKYDAAKISFLLATPVILGAALIKTEEIISLPAQELYTFIVGMISSVIVGLICIQWLLTYLKNNSLLPFIIYRIFLGALILVLYII